MLLSVPVFLLLGARLVAQPRHEFTELHMGVETRIVMYARPARAAAAAKATFAHIAALEDVMSDWRAESEVRRLESHAGEWVRVSPALLDVLARAVDIAGATDGAFDPTMGPVVGLWRDARRRGQLPSAAALDSARERVGWRNLSVDRTRRRVRLALPGMRIDLGGIAKGWILQSALDELKRQGVKSALIEAGGDIVVGDAPPGRAGWAIDAPYADSVLARGARSLVHAAVSTSGPASQFVEIDGVRYSHVVDPRTGIGLTNGLSATVIARDGATADALSTALTVLGAGYMSRVQKNFPGVLAGVHYGERVPRDSAARR